MEGEEHLAAAKVPQEPEAEYVGNVPVRQDITVLPADKDDKKLGFVIYEDFATNNNIFDYSGRAYDTDEADKYIHGQGIAPDRDGNTIWAVMDMLPELNGKPWNNLALNAVLALDPSVIRVAKDGCTLDCLNGRVTIFLESDGRTIRRIEKEVTPGAIGCKTGHDFKTKYKGIELPPPSDEPIIYCNTEAIKRIQAK